MGSTDPAVKAAHLQHFPTQTSLLRSWGLAASGGWGVGSGRGYLKPGRGSVPLNTTLYKTEGIYMPSFWPVLRQKDMAAEIYVPFPDIKQKPLPQ